MPLLYFAIDLAVANAFVAARQWYGWIQPQRAFRSALIDSLLAAAADEAMSEEVEECEVAAKAPKRPRWLPEDGMAEGPHMEQLRWLDRPRQFYCDVCFRSKKVRTRANVECGVCGMRFCHKRASDHFTGHGGGGASSAAV